MTTGYSDRINHAFAFAAKHHDREVRKGTRLPYLTHPANVAIILTRYDQDEETVVAGILHNVIDDCVRAGWGHIELDDRIGEKFGAEMLATALAVVARKLDDEGNDLDKEEQRADQLMRIRSASERSRWLLSADLVHNGSTILADLRRTVDAEATWSRLAHGRVGTIRWYRAVYDRLIEVGFSGGILAELRSVVEALESYGARG